MDPKLIRRVRQQLKAKFGLDTPDDSTPETFLRDQLASLHGHPGMLDNQGELENLDDDEEEDDTDDDQGADFDDREDADTGGQLSHARRGGGVPRLSPARAKKVVAEHLAATRVFGR